MPRAPLLHARASVQATLAAANAPWLRKSSCSCCHHCCKCSTVTRALVQATLAAANVAGRLSGHPVWPKPNDIAPFLDRPMKAFPAACPSIVNAKELGLPTGSDA